MTNAEKRQVIQQRLSTLVQKLLEMDVAFEFYHLWVDVHYGGFQKARIRATKTGYQVCPAHLPKVVLVETPEEVLKVTFPKGIPGKSSPDDNLPKFIDRIFLGGQDEKEGT